MKSKKTSILILSFLSLLLCIPTAFAKVSYGKRELKTSQMYGIKGLLYYVTANSEPTVKRQIIAKVCKAIAWLDKVHKSKKVFELTKIKTDESALIQDSIKVIINIIRGKYENVDPRVIEEWTKTGKKVVAEYKEEAVKNPKTGKKEVKVYYKLYLKK